MLEPNIISTTEIAIAGVSCGQFGTFHLKFHCHLPFGEPLDRESFEWGSRLAADKGTWTLTLAVEKRAVGCGVLRGHRKPKVTISGDKGQLCFPFVRI